MSYRIVENAMYRLGTKEKWEKGSVLTLEAGKNVKWEIDSNRYQPNGKERTRFY